MNSQQLNHSGTDMTTRLISDTQTMSAFLGLLYDLLSRTDTKSLIGESGG